MKPGQDLVIGGYIGLGGTVYAAEKKAGYLRTRFPQEFLDAAGNLRRELEKRPEAAVSLRAGNISMEKVEEGGIFAALWNMAEQHRAGLTVYLRRIPVRQETIEICEALELNPYELCSGGCVLFAADNGNDIVRELEEAGIFGAVAGRVTGGKDRLILNGEIRGYLNRPAPDEIEKIKGDCER